MGPRAAGSGRYTFTTAEARAGSAGASEAAVAAALGRAEADRLIASPVRGFHVVLPLDDRGTGTPSWRRFLDPLLAHLGLPYYVGLLTAASIHGASGQAAQVVQVVTAVRGGPCGAGDWWSSSWSGGPRPRHRSSCGRRRRAGCAWRPPSSLPSTSSAIQRRLPGGATWPRCSGDLAPSLRRAGMREALAVEPSTPELQRLGHLLERAGAASVLAALETELAARRVGWVPLVPGERRPSKPLRDARWHVLVNAEPEGD